MADGCVVELSRPSKTVPLTIRYSLPLATEFGEHADPKLDDQNERVAEHRCLGTGYRVNVARYAVLVPSIMGNVEQSSGFPQFGPEFESAVPGLHLPSASESRSYGPPMNFVSGTKFVGSHFENHTKQGRRAT